MVGRRAELARPEAGAGPAAAPGAALRYFEVMSEAFAAASRRAKSEVRGLRVAGEEFELRFAGGELVPAVLPALEHLAVARGASGAGREPAVTVCLWDSASTGTAAPAFPWGPAEVRERGEVWGFNDARLRTICDATTGRLLMFDRASGRAIYWVASRGHVRWYESAAPLRALLHWALSGEQRFVVHAGAVGDADAGALIAGGSGSGKTSTALACLEAGMAYAGDDYVLLDVSGSVAVAHALFCTAKCDPSALGRMPGLLDAVSNAERLDREKAVLHLGPSSGRRVGSAVAVTALVLPIVSGASAARLRPISPSEGLQRLAPSSIFQLPHAGGGALGTMAELARRVPSFVLELGDDMSSVPGLLAQACGVGRGR